jgi:DNA phosphorothioation-dependent restriction protein DptG
VVYNNSERKIEAKCNLSGGHLLQWQLDSCYHTRFLPWTLSATSNKRTKVITEVLNSIFSQLRKGMFLPVYFTVVSFTACLGAEELNAMCRMEF